MRVMKVLVLTALCFPAMTSSKNKNVSVTIENDSFKQQHQLRVAPVDLLTSIDLEIKIPETKTNASSTFPAIYHANANSRKVDVEYWASYGENADVEYRNLHREFVRKFTRINNHDIVHRGNLPGHIVLNKEEIGWWRENLLDARLTGKKFVDYLGNRYAVQTVSTAKIIASASIWDAGEPRNYKDKPEAAYRGVAFSVLLDKAVSADHRFKFIAQIPIWLVDDKSWAFQPLGRGVLGHKLTDGGLKRRIDHFVLSRWSTAVIDDKLSHVLLRKDGHSEVYSVSAVIDRCHDGWPNWVKCVRGEQNSPWWVYFGVNVKGPFSLVNLGGGQNAGLAVAGKNPGYNYFLLGDINHNGYAEFLYFTDSRAMGNNIAAIYEINGEGAQTVWNWSDFME